MRLQLVLILLYSVATQALPRAPRRSSSSAASAYANSLMTTGRSSERRSSSSSLSSWSSNPSSSYYTSTFQAFSNSYGKPNNKRKPKSITIGKKKKEPFVFLWGKPQYDWVTGKPMSKPRHKNWLTPSPSNNNNNNNNKLAPPVKRKAQVKSYFRQSSQPASVLAIEPYQDWRM